MLTIICETATGAVAIIDPPRDAEDQPILPEGDGYVSVEISDTEAAKFSQPGSFMVDTQGTVVVTPPAPTEADPVQTADHAAYERIAAATTVDEVKTAILEWMASRPGINVPA